MKDLRIPTPSKESVDLSEITAEFQGLVVGYNGNDAVGYIQYSDGDWGLFTDMHWENLQCGCESVVELINSLIRTGKCTHFKVIEFHPMKKK